MANMNLITGYAGSEHVTALDSALFNAQLWGNGQYVFDFGNKFSASIIDNYTVRILDGFMLMQGRLVSIAKDVYRDLTIETGTQGKYRKDLIVARYTQDSVTSVEQVNLVVIKGTEADSEAEAEIPEYTQGNMISGNALENDFPLYEVLIAGVELKSVTKKFGTAVPVLRSSKSDVGHGHQQSDVVGLVAKLAGIDSILAEVVANATTLESVKGRLTGYWWEKCSYVDSWTTHYTQATNYLYGGYSSAGTSVTYYYFDDYYIDDELNVKPVGAVSSVSVTYNNYSNASVLKGKYFCLADPTKENVKYVRRVGENATISAQYTNSYYYLLASEYDDWSTPIRTFTVVDYVFSENSDAYQDGTAEDGYYYRNKQRILGQSPFYVGRYKGTNTSCTDANPMKIAVPFKPKFAIVFSYHYYYNSYNSNYGIGFDIGYFQRQDNGKYRVQFFRDYSTTNAPSGKYNDDCEYKDGFLSWSFGTVGYPSVEISADYHLNLNKYYEVIAFG